MNVGMTSVQMKFWRGFMNVGTASVRINVDVASWQKWSVNVTSWLHGCWHGIGANRALTWLHECWHGFNKNEVLSWLHGKDGCWHGFDANEVLMWLGANIGATSMRVQMLMWSVVVASWQKWIADIASWLQCEWSVDVALWKRWTLAWFRCK